MKINEEIINLQSAITKAKRTKKVASIEAATNDLKSYLSERSILREAMFEVRFISAADTIDRVTDFFVR